MSALAFTEPVPHDVLEAPERATGTGQGLSPTDPVSDPHRQVLRLGIAEVETGHGQDFVG